MTASPVCSTERSRAAPYGRGDEGNVGLGSRRVDGTKQVSMGSLLISTSNEGAADRQTFAVCAFSHSATRPGASNLDLYFPPMMRVAVVIGLCAVVYAPGASAQDAPAPSMRGETLHRMSLLRAAPGRLLELVAAVKGRGLVLRHSQRDQ